MPELFVTPVPLMVSVTLELVVMVPPLRMSSRTFSTLMSSVSVSAAHFTIEIAGLTIAFTLTAKFLSI
jgi:hypothetical protein